MIRSLVKTLLAYYMPSFSMLPSLGFQTLITVSRPAVYTTPPMSARSPDHFTSRTRQHYERQVKTLLMPWCGLTVACDVENPRPLTSHLKPDYGSSQASGLHHRLGVGSQTSKAHAHAHVPQADGGILGARRKPQKVGENSAAFGLGAALRI